MCPFLNKRSAISDLHERNTIRKEKNVKRESYEKQKVPESIFLTIISPPGAVLRIRDAYTDQNFSIPDAESGSRVKKIQDPLQRLNVFVIQKVVSKLWEIWSGMFILDPGSRFFTHPGSRDQKSIKKHWIPDPQHRPGVFPGCCNSLFLYKFASTSGEVANPQDISEYYFSMWLTPGKSADPGYTHLGVKTPRGVLYSLVLINR